MRELLNLSQANIAYTIAATAPRAKGKRATPFDKFVFDFKRAAMSESEKTIEDIHRFFGGIANKG